MEELDQQLLAKFIVEALAEDVGDGDHTSLACIPSGNRNTAELIVKDVGVLAGVEIAKRIFNYVDPDSTVTVFIEDGTDVDVKDVAFEVECNSRALLKAERLVLNTMQRMSGIATLSSRFAVEVEDMPVKILDTRKTTPLLRFLEKYAVRIGGCYNYRDGLYDWIMIKDNHIDACGSITAAVEHVNTYLKENELELGITVEVRNLVELHEVLNVGNITRIMLDNFELPLLEEAVKVIDGRFQVEASGGVTLQTVRKIAETGVHYISSGALTHSAGSLDLSLKIKK
ncbi:carboxylating nicotinate-nucleotide diphosphorylase [Portibacter lacus]|uniref:Probable nicotinate-nucleotide pyrophosphorylase [carboxylating] n=1 Tax=Portibacter lacus TaxID=1099794 RepID=A0AA37SNG0_9BACT|nr:carboxylating nicotinate-nucleotide diphosphorylase [Portibacter lacus]GLR17042.1 nicotinate-nucleotide diphosphorylase (carboxylating) [Portibacter lacus]